MWDTVKRFGKNILKFNGGSGADDFATVMQRAFDSGECMLYLPAGEYRINRPLKIRSGVTLVLDDSARIVAGDGALTKRGDFLLSNASNETGDENITIIGGVWDGNFKNNPKSAIESETGYSGALLNFVNVRNLTLRDMTLCNSAGYFSRFAKLDGFLIEDIRLSHDVNVSNNDGVHLGGYCENGVIRRIHGITRGTPNDDMIALNADDCVTRTENRDLPRGPIKNLLIDDICAESCHCFVRILSLTAEIGNIVIRNVRGGANVRAINIDAARYCRTPLIDPDDPSYTRGVGNIHDVVVDGMEIEQLNHTALIQAETNASNFAVHNFKRASGRAEGETILLRNISPSRIKIYGLSEEQLKQLLEDSELQKYDILRHKDGSRGIDATTDYNDILMLRSGGFAYFSQNKL